MNAVVVLTPDPGNSAALVVFLSCRPCLMLIYNFLNVLTLVLLTFMGQETCQQTVVHQGGAFKYSDFDLKAAFIAVEYRL